MQQIKNLSNIVKERMKILNLTQQQLADATGLSVLTIGAIVRAKEGTSIKNWIIVADALGANLILTNKKMSDETRKSI
jgi:transcriptional regulator with XRE-family HTH domain